MQHLRSSILPRRTGYICASCISKLAKQAARPRSRAFATKPISKVPGDEDELDGDPEKVLDQLRAFIPGLQHDLDEKRNEVQNLKRNLRKQKILQTQKAQQERLSKRQRKATAASSGESSNVTIYEEQGDGTLDLEPNYAAWDKELAKMEEFAKDDDNLKDDDEQLSGRKGLQKALTEKLALDSGARYFLDESERIAKAIRIPTNNYPPSPELVHLNEALSGEFDPFADAKEYSIWKYYAQCRNVLATNWSLVPESTWRWLWQIFLADSVQDHTRFSRVLALKKDMEAAGVGIDDSQMLSYIEGLFLTSDKATALLEWKTQQVRLTFSPVSESNYWALGARMLAHINKPAEASVAAQSHLEVEGGKRDPTVLVPLIASWLASQDAQAVQRAWAVYVRLLVHMGANMSMEDYSACMTAFFTADRADLAVAVFVDMMLTQEPESKERWQSPSKYMSTFGIEDRSILQDLQTSSKEIGWTSSQPPIEHPTKFRNKFFYHSLVKKLLGDGETAWAEAVGALMSLRNIPADAKVWNGIIGAFFRTGKAKATQKGEELAWAMINERIAFVSKRARHFEESEVPLRTVEGPGSEGFIRMRSAVSGVHATSETFALLAETYVRHRKEQGVRDLFRVIGIAKVLPTTDFMNSILHHGILSDRRRWTWSTFRSLTNDYGVHPDFNTFGLLWQLAKKNWDAVKTSPTNARIAGYPNARSLFAEMMKWNPLLAGKQIPDDLYQLIVATFGVLDDQIGTGIALRAMHVHYGALPDEQTVRKIILQISGAGITNAAGFRPRRLNMNAAGKKRASAVAELMAEFQSQRFKAMKRQGRPFHLLSENEKSEEMILLLLDVLRHVVQQRTMYTNKSTGDIDPVTFRQLAEEAAEQMGIDQDIRLPWYTTKVLGTAESSTSIG